MIPIFFIRYRGKRNQKSFTVENLKLWFNIFCGCHTKKIHNEKKNCGTQGKIDLCWAIFFSLDAICRLNKIISLFIEEGMQKGMGYTSKCISKGLESISIRIFSQIILLRVWLAYTPFLSWSSWNHLLRLKGNGREAA